ncbi:major facilitator superfamily transporter [Cordyceps fumosorosea ARSEF 2679]|uniref:Major facilitator superfamily transporter n=1 Tax=Cordyceps fumosorosea (strain ARSEF 2679) TaxID=1081104 RepID=A0A167YA80_CORFA|nr:major facilitator superfamily transporter [Cordyceps fumosorosea ARSEF 2679]OAA66056.1 major facilitator superfamily transporter [Cordyceps fumosorosea ARSEF 2679]
MALKVAHDSDIGSADHASIPVHQSHHELTRRVLFKADIRVLPLVALLFLCSFLDRTNVGNAKIIGLEKDIHINPSQYRNGLAIYYACYIASEVPSNLIIKKVSPKIWLPFLTFSWGIITIGTGFMRDYKDFMILRAVLGIFEGGLLPGIVLYLSSMYTRSELAVRIGMFYTGGSLSGAFGGLLARGLSAIGPRGGLEGWRWIFIMEGVITAIVAAFSYLGLPNSLQEASFLTKEEQQWAVDRLEQDGGGRFSRALERAEPFQWSEVRRGMSNVQVWLSSTAYFAILSGLYSFGLFLPTIVKEIGIASDANQVQLWSVIPFAVATPFTVLVALLSDHLKVRGIIMLCVIPIAIAGYAVIANTKSPETRFAMTCLMALGMYCAVPPVLVWNSNNSAGHYKRATTSGLQLAIANAGGFVATFVYPDSQEPYYHKGHTVILGLLCYAWLAVLANIFWLWG